MDQSRTSVVDAERSGTGTGFGRGHRGVEFVGFELLPVNECGETVKMVECEYTRDSEAMMQWVYNTAFCIARKPVSSD